MNKTFFIGVANTVRYIVTTDRAVYLRNVLLSPALLLLICIMSIIIDGSWSFRRDISGIATFTSCLCGLWIVYFSFRPLHNRSSRTEFLTLPTSNGQKFLAMISVCVCSIVITFLLSLLVALVLWNYKSTGFFDFSEQCLYTIFGCYSFSRYAVVTFLTRCLLLPSFILLVSSFRYSRNVLFAIVLVSICAFLFQDLNHKINFSILQSHSLNYMENDFWFRNLAIVRIVLYFALSVGCWWIAYRRLCHAQLTSRLNH